MEEKKKSNTLSTIVIVVLVILIIGLAGFITYDKVLNKDNNCVEEKEEVVDNNDTSEEVVENNTSNEVVKGECPLEKFNNNYTLTASDKEEIAETIVAMPAFVNISKDIIVEALKINKVSKSGYFFNAGWKEDPSISGGDVFFYVSKVNGKFKIIGGGGSGDVADGYKRMEDTINNICS